MHTHNFNPNNITKDDMKRLAEAIKAYVDELENVMVIPDDLVDKYEDEIKEGIKRTRKLIKKLEHGDKSVFKDEDEWNYLE